MRLQKYLAYAGAASRRRAEAMIRDGKVKVNGQTIRTMGFKVKPGIDKVSLNGSPLKLKSNRTYILLYKPRGYITTVIDPQGRPKVTDLIKNVPARLYPVGRLDMDTEGLLLLTDDGELTLRLTHPRYEVPKTYLAWVKGSPKATVIKQLRQGVRLGDGLTAPARVKICRAYKNNTLLQLTLIEGRKRQVRRMLAQVKHPVIWLKRSQMAFLTLRGLRPGEYRRLTGSEVKRLYHLAGLGDQLPGAK